ncbi:MAG: hypothetical protein GX654_02465 [Desulfatiglans sp.]|jgi:hypothetical protein|nr:hypothetical protein [Desulfatiglans sp.]
MGKYIKLSNIIFFVSIALLSNTQLFAMGLFPKPPGNNPPVINNPPPSAPTPHAIVLIGMGACGVAGFYLGRRKKKQ